MSIALGESTATLENHCRHLLYARLSKNNANTRTTKPENLKYGFCPVLKLQCMPCTHVPSSSMCAVCVCSVCVCLCVLMLVFLTLSRLCALFIIIYLLCNFQHLLETSQSFCPGCLARNNRTAPHRIPPLYGVPLRGSDSGTAAQSHLDLAIRWPLWPPTWTNFIWQPILVQNKLPLMCERPKQLAVASWNIGTQLEGRHCLEVCVAFAVHKSVLLCRLLLLWNFRIIALFHRDRDRDCAVAVLCFGLYPVDSRNYGICIAVGCVTRNAFVHCLDSQGAAGYLAGSLGAARGDKPIACHYR